MKSLAVKPMLRMQEDGLGFHEAQSPSDGRASTLISQGQRDKDQVIAQLQAQLAAAATAQQGPGHYGVARAGPAPLSPDSLGTITLVESDAEGSGKASAGASTRAATKMTAELVQRSATPAPQRPRRAF